jgi:antitoxin (DNA-binding transcriptional repressor) of toxin-antitoxin stability system
LKTLKKDGGRSTLCLANLLAQALAGNEVIITEHGKPVARLVAIPASASNHGFSNLEFAQFQHD